MAERRSSPEQPPIERNRVLWSHPYPGSVRVLRVDHSVGVPSAGYDGGHQQEGGAALLDPGFPERLGHGGVERVVPSRVSVRIECLPRDIVRHNRFDVAGGAWGRLLIRVDQNFKEADGEARARVDCRQSWRVPALAENPGTLPGPNRM